MGTGWLQWFEDWAINRDMQKVALPKMTWSTDRYAKKKSGLNEETDELNSNVNAILWLNSSKRAGVVGVWFA